MRKHSFAVVVLALFLWATLLIIYPPQGYDYDIYTHNADLTIAGQQAFGRTNGDGAFAGHYLDYTGAQHLIYVVLRLIPFGFSLWTLGALVLCLILVLRLRGIGLAALIAFHPTVWQMMVVASWEDKLLLLAIPLIVLYGLRRRRHVFVAVVIGACTALNGVLVFFVPVFLLYVWRVERWAFPRVLAALLVSFGVVMLPFFPAALAGWQNRAVRMALPTPFWWSLWRLLPSGLYAPWMDKAATVVVVGVTLYAFVRRRIGIETALILALVPVLVLGVYNDMYKYVPMFILIACVYRRASLWTLAITLALYLPLIAVGNLDITPPLLLVCFAPFVVVGLSAWRPARVPRRVLAPAGD